MVAVSAQLEHGYRIVKQVRLLTYCMEVLRLLLLMCGAYPQAVTVTWHLLTCCGSTEFHL